MSATPPPALPRDRRFVLAPRRVPPWAVMLGSIVVPALICSGFGAIAVLRSFEHYQKRAELLSLNLATAVERSLAANVDKVDLALTSTVVQLETQLEAGQLDRYSIERHMREQMTLRPELDGLLVTDDRGLEFVSASSGGKRKPADISDRDYFILQRDRPDSGLSMSRPVVSRVTEQWVLPFSRPYRHVDGNFAGSAAVGIPLAVLTRELAAIDVGPHGTVALRHADLGLIASHPSNPAAPAHAIGNRDVAAALRALASTGQPSGTIRAARDPDGVDRTTTLRRLNGLPLIVTVGLADQDYLVDWYADVRTNAGFGLAIVAACTLGAAMVLRAQAQNRDTRQRMELLAKAFEHSAEAIIIADRQDRILEVNPAFTRRNGRSAAEVIGRKARSLLAPTIGEAELDKVRAALRRTSEWRGELLEAGRNGHETPIWTSIAVVRDDKGRASHLVSNTVDLTELKRAEAKIVHLAHHDMLTKLPNRVQLLARLKLAIATAHTEGAELPMLFIDMDRFKNINDTLGHPVGDALLVEVANRLRALVRGSDIVARLGGDEFVLVLVGAGQRGVPLAQSVAIKVLDSLGQPYRVQGHELHSTPSIGIGIFPHDGADVDALMKAADTAMYQAKANGRNNYRFFTADMRRSSDERLAIEAGLRMAIERGELLLHYQPQLDLASGRIVGLEALLRWQHPERGMVPPLKFIPVAEDTGLIEPIGAWVIGEALAQIARWRSTIDPRLRVAVNLSAQQLRTAAVVRVVEQALGRQGLTGNALELEVTESAAMHDPARTATLLSELRALGIAVAIDDFGTGYSSLAYLKRLPLSCLKLDRSFVMDIEHDPNDAAISKATIQLAHSLGLAVVAEGVENATQLEFLRTLGCDTVQGYLIAKPLPAAECERLLADAAAEVEVEPAALPA